MERFLRWKRQDKPQRKCLDLLTACEAFTFVFSFNANCRVCNSVPGVSFQDKQQGAMDRSWESMSRSQASPPAWVRKDTEPLQASPLDLQGVEWEKAGAAIPLVGQDIIDLQTEV